GGLRPGRRAATLPKVEPGDRPWSSAGPSMPSDSAGRYGPADDPGYEGFHTYATSDLYDTNGGAERWPDNWAGGRDQAYEPEHFYEPRHEPGDEPGEESDAAYERAI